MNSCASFSVATETEVHLGKGFSSAVCVWEFWGEPVLIAVFPDTETQTEEQP